MSSTSSLPAWYIIFPAIVGVCMTFQGAITGKMGQIGGKAFSSVLVCTLSLLCALVSWLAQTRGGTSTNFILAASQAPWWSYLGGILGGYYLFIIILLVPRVGVALFFISSILVQLLFSAVFDTVGFVGYTVRAVTPGRLVGIALVFVGVLVVNFGADFVTWVMRGREDMRKAGSAAELVHEVSVPEIDGKNEATITIEGHGPMQQQQTATISQKPTLMANVLLLMFPLMAGMALLVQAGMNGTLGSFYGYPFASFYSLSTSLVTLLFLYAYEYYQAPTDFRRIVREAPWWCWCGGFLSYAYVFASTTLATRLGAAVFMGTVMAAQVICAVVLDHFGILGLAVKKIDWIKGLGVFIVLKSKNYLNFRDIGQKDINRKEIITGATTGKEKVLGFILNSNLFVTEPAN
ncbi:hypothetical protein BC830DRAFT_307875 [Chytriomyces sp. MP71]|nr:hypothetical protein BC830DRAFT_307875 [Chytriomyces sp. MP71]